MTISNHGAGIEYRFLESALKSNHETRISMYSDYDSPTGGERTGAGIA